MFRGGASTSGRTPPRLLELDDGRTRPHDPRCEDRSAGRSWVMTPTLFSESESVPARFCMLRNVALGRCGYAFRNTMKARAELPGSPAVTTPIRALPASIGQRLKGGSWA